MIADATSPLLADYADVLRRIVSPDPWDTQETIQRDAAIVLARIAPGIDVDAGCPHCRSPLTVRVRP